MILKKPSNKPMHFEAKSLVIGCFLPYDKWCSIDINKKSCGALALQDYPIWDVWVGWGLLD